MLLPVTLIVIYFPDYIVSHTHTHNMLLVISYDEIKITIVVGGGTEIIHTCIACLLLSSPSREARN